MNTKRFCAHFTLVAMLAATTSPYLKADGERTNVRGIGMGYTAVATSRGLDAVGINPANLAYPDVGSVTISLIPFGVHVGSDFLTLGLYNEYFTGVNTDSGRVGRYLGETDKQRILSAFPGGLGFITGDVEARLFGFSLQFEDFGSFAFTVTEHAVGFVRIPKEYAQFLFYGNPPGSAYDFSQSSFRGTWTREYALAFGRHLPSPGFLKSLAGGVAVKLVHGYGYSDLVRFNTHLVTSSNGMLDGSIDVFGRAAGVDAIASSDKVGYNAFPAPAGTGVGFDLGVAGEVNDFLRFGLSVTDVGSVRWTRNTKEVFDQAIIHMDDPLDAAQRDSVENAVKGTSRPAGAFSTPLPTAFRVGLAVELHNFPFVKRILMGEMIVACDYVRGFDDILGSTKADRFSVGMEYKPWKFLPLRTGVTFGGLDHFSFALGLGFHLGVFDLDLASESLGWLFSPDKLSRGSVAMGMRVRI